MNPIKQKIYKCLTRKYSLALDKEELRSWSWAARLACDVVYEPNKLVRAPFGKFFAFAKLNDAKYFIQNDSGFNSDTEIWEGDGYGVEMGHFIINPHKVILREDLDLFWKDPNGFAMANGHKTFRVPVSTVLCRSIKLLRKVV